MPKLEAKIILAAFILSGLHLALIAFAAVKLGITVPGCVTNVKPFTTGKFIVQGPTRYEVHVVAHMWAFEPRHIRVPKGSVVDFYLTSNDITHGFHIDKTNVNLMAVPKVVNYAQAHFKTPGRYSIVCHEYCGAAHHMMNGVIEVTDSTEEGSAVLAPAPSAAEGAPAAGHQLFASKGCAACHSIDGTKGIGPSLKGLFGRSEKFTDGSSIAAIDAAYVEESIRDPQKRVVATFANVMPKLLLTNEEIQQLVGYLKTLQ